MPYKVAILTISDAGYRGTREDTSGEQIRLIMSTNNFHIISHEIVPDDSEKITEFLLKSTCYADLIITTGGTGLGPRDVTPEATADVIERPVPGLPELMRAETRSKTPMAALSRGVSGIRNHSLIINLPGNPRAVQECLSVILPLLPHALETIKGPVSHHPIDQN
ncbi:MogA/MoaB family molybdenum cofactor biosynthesis protein [SAR202 cluster bacterium AD-802-E10_MRT_200m]|nr:MogA/MoaB family molybdenum cofactor biosynthesis protein [SAR202 cluster bacterium AD-802-E10_MRT_200m]